MYMVIASMLMSGLTYLAIKLGWLDPNNLSDKPEIFIPIVTIGLLWWLTVPMIMVIAPIYLVVKHVKK